MNKVLFVINGGVYPYVVGGMEVFNYHLIKTLSQSHDVSYMATKKYDFTSAQYIKSCSLRPTKFFAPIWLFIYLLFHREYKHVIFSFSSAHWLVWKLSTISVKLLNLDSTIVIHYGKAVPKQNLKVYRNFFKSAKNVIAVSEDIKKNYDLAYGISCEVIHPLVPFQMSNLDTDEIRKKYDIPRAVNVISMVGTLKEMKNPQMALKALSLFSKHELEIYNPYVVYVGTGPMLENLKFEVDRLRLNNRVKFLGLIPTQNISEIMKMTDVYLIASDFEGTSVSALEAMYNSKPIIASCVPGLKEMFHHDFDALLYQVNDSEELKSSIISLLENPEKARQMGKSAKELFNLRYDHQEMIRKYIDMIQK